MTYDDIIEIQRLLTDFNWFADRGDGENLAALFLPDAVLCVADLELRGREAIASDCYRRFAVGPRKTRHLWSNFRLEQDSEQEASTTIVQITVEQTSLAKPIQMRVNDVFDSFRRDINTSWRFMRRVIRREMALVIPYAVQSPLA